MRQSLLRPRLTQHSVVLEAIVDVRTTDAALAVESVRIGELKTTWEVEQKAYDELKAALKDEEAKT